MKESISTATKVLKRITVEEVYLEIEAQGKEIKGEIPKQTERTVIIRRSRKVR